VCIVAAKYFKGTGWVGVKNRDRNYKPTVKIRQSFKKDIERLYIWDEKTKYTEGLNEFGVCILSAAVAVKDDEKEGSKEEENPDKVFYSPDGKKVRTALFEKTVDKALKKLIELEIAGNTLVFDTETLYLLEGAFDEDDNYQHVVKKIPKTETIVRTNHGVLIPWAGYQNDEESDDHERAARISSESRLKKVREDIKKITVPENMFDCVSDTSNKDPQLNPIRLEKTHGKTIMRTTGQLMIVSSEKTLHYRPIWSEVEFDFGKIDHPSKKTSFEVVSSKRLLSFKECVEKA